MPRHTFLSLLAVLCVAAGAAHGYAQTYTTGAAVMAAVDARPAPKALISTMTMTITSRSGQSLTRTMRIWSADGGDSEVVKFTAPADIAGSGFLSLKRADGSTDAMVYLPALDRTRRIAGSQKQQAFFGSDFSYEDISDLQTGTHETYDNELLKVDPGPVYVVQATPRPGTDTSYSKLVLHVPEATLIPSRIEFYRAGALLKVMTIGKTTVVDGYTLPSEMRMASASGGSTTTLQQSDVSVAASIPAEVFTERFLTR